ncbi:hypothetical protein ppKF707_4752 [Metapseudomonas furukawaii]|uniref:Uncharacterized protein n=1 Tax=Metapseudomonas furukawaii TaxID=1149133 RepID=A0AAD1BY23_METFU|nr:hypothetical protein ppKF707_4752 [Pseudomonas furukawaii]BAU73176.1 hypothetical protein KF707C_14880 [Pseudomonas furukawaii]
MKGRWPVGPRRGHEDPGDGVMVPGRIAKADGLCQSKCEENVVFRGGQRRSCVGLLP